MCLYAEPREFLVCARSAPASARPCSTGRRPPSACVGKPRHGRHEERRMGRPRRAATPRGTTPTDSSSHTVSAVVAVAVAVMATRSARRRRVQEHDGTIKSFDVAPSSTCSARLVSRRGVPAIVRPSRDGLGEGLRRHRRPLPRQTREPRYVYLARFVVPASTNGTRSEVYSGKG